MPVLARRLLLLLPLPFAVAFGAWGSAKVADRVGAEAASALVPWAALARPAAVPEQSEPPLVVLAADTSSPAAAPRGQPRRRSPKHRQRVAAAGPSVIFVGKDSVLRLASSGAVPRGVPVPASGARPAGVRLFGVSALGIGLRDGDVLTRALGVPALSSGAVVHAVLAARARHAAVLEGEVWRGDQRIVLRVEQPYGRS